MARPLGKNQLQQLFGMAAPSSLLIVGDDAVSQSLVRRGLLKPMKPERPGAFLQITPAGMRVLADAFEAGSLDQFFKWPPGLMKGKR